MVAVAEVATAMEMAAVIREAKEARRVTGDKNCVQDNQDWWKY